MALWRTTRRAKTKKKPKKQQHTTDLPATARSAVGHRSSQPGVSHRKIVRFKIKIIIIIHNILYLIKLTALYINTLERERSEVTATWAPS